jgi:ATP-dependent helicase/nuclease subunit B
VTLSPLRRPGSRWFSIPAHRPFADDLAAGLLAHFAGEGPEALSSAIVLTPTRRGGRTLAEAFLRQSPAQALLLPQILPLGELDEGEPPFEPGDLSLILPPAITPWRRRFELARLTAELMSGDAPVLAVLDMADALAAFLDSLQIEEIDPDSARDRLAGLVDEDLAGHWQISANLLDALLLRWPRRLEDLGLVDVADRRVRLLKALTAQWLERPPTGVLVAAGSTGTAPSTADLLIAIAQAPRGAVVLPGLDEGLADKAWGEVGEQHPQGAMKRLLQRALIDRGQVETWLHNDDSRGRWRRRVINEALRPPIATADWLEQIANLRTEAAGEGLDPIAEGLHGLALVTTTGDEEAALACALLVRETLEEPGKTVALVTPDLVLARRVSTRLARWGIEADASAGRDLSGFPTATAALLVSRLSVEPADPVRLLAVLKSPVVRLGLEPAALEAAAAVLEELGVRGSRPDGLEAVLASLAAAGEPGRGRAGPRPEQLALLPAAGDLMRRLWEALALARAPFANDDGVVAPAQAARALVGALESLGAGPDGDFGDLWAGPDGEAIGGVLAALVDEGEALPPATVEGFADLLQRLVGGESVRAAGVVHPRVRILGALEARMTSADRLVLAGLEEGVWPRPAPTDPFLSRPMRKQLGLPEPERRIGLTAHDFAQAACARDVVLVHAQRREGSPAVESRWLWRLRTLARGAGVKIPGRDDILAWARGLDAAAEYSPIARPAPVPPLGDRPRRMAVTRLEALTRDPYAVWARDILRLYPLARPDEPVEARARGTAIHKAFERLSEAFPGPVPANAAELFEGFYMEELRAAGMPAPALTREAALAKEAARWVAALEVERRADGRKLVIEAYGELAFEAPGGRFVLNARADRIELDPTGVGHILDYKTGKAPSKKVVEAGFSPQLTLTAAILMAGGFKDAPATPPGDLTYLEITGRKPAGKVEVRGEAGPDSLDKTERALAGAKELVARFDDPKTPYVSRTAPQFVHDYAGDYGHLARVFEWSTSGDDGDGE